MLPEPLRTLISAYAIGDLSAGRRAAAVRLLRHSDEARLLLRALKQNRRRLRALPRPALPLDFTAQVISALPSQSPIIQPLPRTYSGRTRASSVRWAAAVAVLMAVAVGAYLVGSRPRESASPGRTIARRSQPGVDADLAQLPRPEFQGEETATPEQADVPKSTLSEPEGQNPSSPKKNRSPVVKKPAPRPDPLGTTATPPSSLTIVSPPRLLTLPVRDVDSSDGRSRLQKELSASEVHHIDLFCKDILRAFDRLQAAVKARGIHLIVDGRAQVLHNRKLQVQYLLYCDDLTAVEWTQMLQSLAAADKKPGENLFDQIVVLPFDAADKTELTAVAGSDLTRPDRRPGPAAKKDVRSALAAAVVPFRNSKEMSQYVDGHRERGPGDIAVMLVLRLPGS